MPNGVSCAYFAARNLVSGTKEHNIFREGIATAQTLRTADAIASSAVESSARIAAKTAKAAAEAADAYKVAANAANEAAAKAAFITAKDAAAKASALKKSSAVSFLSKSAKFCCDILYPLIIASGVYNTVKSDDKVKTGVSQGGAIASMYCFEKSLEKIQKKIVPNIINKIKPKLSKATLKKIKGFTNNLSSNKYGKILKYVLQGILFATVSMTGYNVGSKVSAKIVDKVRENKYKNSSSNEVETGYTSPKYNENVFDDIEVIKE